MQPHLIKTNFSLLEQVTWTPSNEDARSYHLSKTSKVTKPIQKTPSKEKSFVSQVGVDNSPPPKWLQDDIIDFYCHIYSMEPNLTIPNLDLSIRACRRTHQCLIMKGEYQIDSPIFSTRTLYSYPLT